MPRGLTTDQKAALGGRVRGIAHFMSLVLPVGTSRVWTGLGEASVLGATWYGLGDLFSVSELTTDTDVRSQRVSIQLAGIPRDAVPSTVVAATRNVRYQGAALTLYVGLIDLNTGAPIGEPTAVWAGLADTVAFNLGETISATLTGDQLSSHMRRANGLLMTSEQHNFRLGNVIPKDIFFDPQNQLMGAPRPAFS